MAYAGLCSQIDYARARDGSYPAKQFFEALPENVKYQFAVLFKKLGDTGRLFNKEQFRAIAGTEFFAFKCGRYSIFCRVIDGELVLLTNGFEKKRNFRGREALKRAEEIYGDQIASETTGSSKTQ